MFFVSPVDCIGICLGEVLGVVQSILTAPPLASSPTTTFNTELALPAQPLLEIVHETPATAHDDMDLDAPLWERDASEDEYIDGWRGIEVKGDLDVEDK